MMKRRLLKVLVAATFFSQSALASDLLDAWRAAQLHDLDYSAAQAAHEAGLAQHDQSNALWRPTVQLIGTAGRMDNQTQTQGAQFSAPGFPATAGAAFNTSINNGNLERWGVSARQPLISGERLSQSRELDLNADMAELEWASARQKLMLRTAERYFDVVFAQEALAVSRQQEVSVKKALDEVNARYRLGDIPVTDTHEAAARMEAIKAQTFASDVDLQVKQAAFIDATGLMPQQVTVQQPGAGDLSTPLATLETWLSDATTGNPDLLIQKKRVVVASEQSARHGVLASPSLDLVGELSRDRLTGSGDYGAASNASRAALIGIQLTIPLYSGGMRSAKHDESEALARKAFIEADRAQQQIALQTRSAWLGLNTGKGRVQALAASLKASEARLNATRLGRQVGDRSTLDLLNAENDAANARLSLLQARIALIMDRLRLWSLTGQLDEAQLQQVNRVLQK